MSAPLLTAIICAAATLHYAVPAGLPWAPFSVRGPETLAVVAMGARSTPLVADAGEAWRLLTCHFVHTSWLHLGFNLAFFFPVGGALEQVLNRRDYAALLLFCATASATASLLGTPQVSAGASGLVFGVLAASVMLGIHHRHRLGPRLQPYFGWWVLPFLLVVLVLGLGNPAVDQSSHVGGLVAGIAAGSLLELRTPTRSRRSPPYALLAAIAVTASVLLAAPWLARGGRGPRSYPLEGGLSVEVPHRWVPRFGPLGERQFVTAGGLVVLASERPPPHIERFDLWYREHRLAPLSPQGEALYLELGRTEVRTQHTQGFRVRYRLERHAVVVVRDVFFLTPVTGEPAVLSFEAPLSWSGKYDETLASIVGSIRTPRQRDEDPTPTLSAAALK